MAQQAFKNSSRGQARQGVFGSLDAQGGNINDLGKQASIKELVNFRYDLQLLVGVLQKDQLDIIRRPFDMTTNGDISP